MKLQKYLYRNLQATIINYRIFELIYGSNYIFNCETNEPIQQCPFYDILSDCLVDCTGECKNGVINIYIA